MAKDDLKNNEKDDSQKIDTKLLEAKIAAMIATGDEKGAKTLLQGIEATSGVKLADFANKLEADVDKAAEDEKKKEQKGQNQGSMTPIQSEREIKQEVKDDLAPFNVVLGIKEEKAQNHDNKPHEKVASKGLLDALEGLKGVKDVGAATGIDKPSSKAVNKEYVAEKQKNTEVMQKGGDRSSR